MRPTLITCVLLSSLCLSPGCSRRRAPEPAAVTRAISAEAIPVRNWLHSIKARDVELFKTVFSDRWLPVLERQGWGPMLGAYTTLWTENLGDFDVDHLTFEFTPSPIEGVRIGHVTVTRDDTSFPPIRVVFEDGCWKVDEL